MRRSAAFFFFPSKEKMLVGGGNDTNEKVFNYLQFEIQGCNMFFVRFLLKKKVKGPRKNSGGFMNRHISFYQKKKGNNLQKINLESKYTC